MATRLYISNNPVDKTLPAIQGTWTASTNTNSGQLWIKSGAATTAAFTSTNTGDNDMLARFQSPPLSTSVSFATTDTLNFVTGALLNTVTNTTIVHRVYCYVVESDGSTIRGVLANNINITGTAWTATATGRGPTSAFNLSNNVTAQVGDRIVIEIGTNRTGSNTTNRVLTINYGNTGATDLTLGSTSVTTQPGWIEFSGTFINSFAWDVSVVEAETENEVVTISIAPRTMSVADSETITESIVVQEVEYINTSDSDVFSVPFSSNAIGSSLGVIRLGDGRQVIRTSTSVLYSVVYNAGTIEVYKSSTGSSWTNQDAAHSPVGQSGFTAIAIDSTNTLHIVYIQTGSTFNVFHVTYNTSTDLFGTPEQAIAGTSSNNPAALDLAIDSNDIPHVVVGQATAASNRWVYSNKIGGSWNTAVSTTVTNGVASLSINIDDNNLPQVAAYEILTAVSASIGNVNNATSFTRTSLAASGAISSAAISIVTDSSNNTWVSYTDNTNKVTLIKHLSTDAWSTWQAAVTNNDAGKGTSLIALGQSIYVFYEKNSGGTIAYEQYTGSWSGEQSLIGTTYHNVRARWSNFAFINQYSVDLLFDDGATLYWGGLVVGTASESVTVIESSQSTYTISVTEAESVADSIIVTLTSIISISEIETETEAVFVSIVDCIATTEVESIGEQLLYYVDKVYVLDSVNVQIISGSTTLTINVSDTETESELVIVKVPLLGLITISEVETETESVIISVPLLGLINVSDIETETESVTVREFSFLSVSDSESESDVVVDVEIFNFISVTDTESEGESVTIEEINILSVIDIESEAELVTIKIPTLGNISVADSESEIDIPTLNLTSFINVTDSQSEAESVTITIGTTPLILSVSDSESEADVLVDIEIFNFISVLDIDTETESVTIKVPLLGVINVNDSESEAELVTIKVPTLGLINVSDAETETDLVQSIEIINFISVSDVEVEAESIAIQTSSLGTVNVLVVAGGGGGGSASGGGGGAGGYQANTSYTVTSQTYVVTVGTGGSGGAVGFTSGGDGLNSSFSAITSIGGGGGGCSTANGDNGGSGGGGGGGDVSAPTGGIGTGGQGNNGGAGRIGSGGSGSNDGYNAGGGGGANAVGADAVALQAGNGGAGISNSISGSPVTYAGGGGGGPDNFRIVSGGNGTGGAGGGGAGGNNANGSAANANTGGGGGGGSNRPGNQAGGDGASGIVVISFPIDGSTGVSTQSTGGTITTVAGNQIHTFTTSGTWTMVSDRHMSVSDAVSEAEVVTILVGSTPALTINVSDVEVVTETSATYGLSSITYGSLTATYNGYGSDPNIKIISFISVSDSESEAESVSINILTVRQINVSDSETEGELISIAVLPYAIVNVLVVAGGGGGGGGNTGGGGGAGGLLANNSFSLTAGSYPVTVGLGGSGGSGSFGTGQNGNNSSFSTLTAIGGGGSGSNNTNGSNGGSGGGGGGGDAVAPTGGIGVIGQGNNGGAGIIGSGGAGSGVGYNSGGGGGSSVVGADATTSQSGNGGNGTVNSISGSSVTYAGGGGGGVDNFRITSGGNGTGGTGGGGAGGSNSSQAGTAGTVNTGGGGGGAGGSGALGGDGGSGIVVIAFPIDGTGGLSTLSSGGTITQVGGNQIHTFTASGTFIGVGVKTINVSDAETESELVVVKIPTLGNINVNDVETESELVTIKVPLVGLISVLDVESIIESVTIKGINIITVSDSQTENELVVMAGTEYISISDSEAETELVNIETINQMHVSDAETEVDVVSNIETIDQGIFVSDSEVESELVTIKTPLLGLINVTDSETENESVSLLIQITGTESFNISDVEAISELVTIKIPLLGIISVVDIEVEAELVNIDTVNIINVSDLDASTSGPIELLSTPLYSSSSLISYWDFDAGNSNDNKGSNNGSDTNTAYSNSFGMFGEGVYLDGTASSAITDTGFPTGNSDRTVVAWVNPQDLNQGGGTILFFGTDASTPSSFEVWVGQNGISPSIGLRTGSGGVAQSANGGHVSQNVWHHVAWVWTGSNTTITFYIDGLNAGSSSTLDALTTTLTGTGTIGHGHLGYFNGYVDELAVFTRALSTDEVNKIANGGWGIGDAVFMEQFSSISVSDVQSEIESTTINLTSFINVHDTDIETDVIVDIELIDQGINVFDIQSQNELVSIKIAALGAIVVSDVESESEVVVIEIIEQGIVVSDSLSEAELITIQIPLLGSIAVNDTEAETDSIVIKIANVAFSVSDIEIITESIDIRISLLGLITISDTQTELEDLSIEVISFISLYKFSVVDRQVESETVTILITKATHQGPYFVFLSDKQLILYQSFGMIYVTPTSRIQS